ncbi:hypothetical protein AR543_13790 [Paenibacillus bovis]|uniref:Beta-lactamase-related domain-containing protein n=2 Tax=Paenibacillus bovis TaxID=1616788 RepID=A0A172ZMD5_9BACL|nr:hypothetical protein AR543_13790 [Paenibacillus bovis]
MLFTLLVFTLIGGVLLPYAGKTDAAPKQNASFSPAEVDQFMQQTMRKLHIPGASIAIVHGKKMIYAKGYGKADRAGKPVTPTTSFVIGSMSKTVTAAAIMQLAEQKKIRLDDPVQQYLPWFRLADEQALQQITIADLLHQTSGLPQVDGIKAITQGSGSLEQHIRSLQNVSPQSTPGHTFEYSNLNYNILGGIVEAISGQTYEDYISSHIFQPLNMSHSYASRQQAQLAGEEYQGYQPILGWMLPTAQLEHSGTVPSGYLMSSAEDMAHFLIAQMNKGQFGSNRLLSPASIAAMHAPASDMGEGAHYAMGWVVESSTISHNGSTENSYSKMMIDGEYGIVVLTNSLDYLDSASYEGILTGIQQIIHHESPEPVGRSAGTSAIYMIINLLSVVLVLLLIWRLVRLFQKGLRPSASRGYSILRIILIILLQIALPALLIWYAGIALVSWPVILLFLPGMGHAFLAGLVLWILLGILKLIWLARHKGHSRSIRRSYP